ncbi:Pectinesterase inhibitor domain [Dillenia turbinata]|uniref:Pectinesterase inhibitor domain n=1 Tax=Dillenia turbinata TaxID=194707 RepID=A0AAN8VBN6_9MAGN
MARLSISLVLLVVVSILSLCFPAESAAAPASKTTSTTNFIKASCKVTRYPAVCVQSLAVYATTIQQSRKELAHTALAVSLARAQSMKQFVTKLTKFRGLKHREYEAIKDCAEEISDTIDRISNSVQELKSMGTGSGQDFSWHMSNVETWVSAALTDENTCFDGFAGQAMDGRIKNSVRARVINVAQVTSNALALVNQFAGRH